MAMIQCPECGNSISDKAKFCIHCGCPNEFFTENEIEIQQEPVYIPILSLEYKKWKFETEGNILKIYKNGRLYFSDHVKNYSLLFIKKGTFGTTEFFVTNEKIQESIQIVYNENDKKFFKLETLKEIATKHMTQNIQKSWLAACNYQTESKRNGETICPVCGSREVSFDAMTSVATTKGNSEIQKKDAITRAGNKAGRAGMIMATGGLWALTPKKSDYKEIKNEKTVYTTRTVCICQKCGYNWYKI